MYKPITGKKQSINILFKLLAIIIAINLLSFKAYASDEFIDQARSIIKNYYVDEVPPGALNATKIEDMVKALNDPYSSYFVPEKYKEFTNSIDMKLVGIGVTIESIPEGTKIISVLKGAPAEEAGLKAGDIITEADGNKLAGLPSDKAASYIKGREGTKVNLKINRSGTVYTYDVERRQIAFPTVQGEVLDGHIGYIAISSFGEVTSDDFKTSLNELEKQNVDCYIIDLRNNGGGYLSTALEIAGNFIGEKTVVLTRDKAKKEQSLNSPDSTENIDKPVIVLVNGYSASASEVLSAALKDYNKAYLIGNRTYGKGTVQGMFELFDGSMLKLTIQRFYSPLGKTIDKVGVLPDLEMDNMDSLLAARLLFGSSGTRLDKRGYIKINASGREFEIDLSKARFAEYWNIFRHIIDNYYSLGNEIYIGTDNGWKRADISYLNNIIKLYYPLYRETGGLNNVPVDKVFTVKFTKDIISDSINNDSIELINSFTGDRVPVGFEFIDKSSVKVYPKEKLVNGYTYYLVVNNSITGDNGQKLKEGTITRVSVMQ